MARFLLLAWGVVVIVSRSGANVMPLDRTWIQLDQTMVAGEFFNGFWAWSSSRAVHFRITDVDVVSDQFNIYDQGIFAAATLAVPSWSSLGIIDPFQSPPFTGNPDEAYNSGYFSRADLFFAPGFHSLTIQDISIPFDPTGVPIPDGTVAFQASAVPESSASLALAVGLLMLGGSHWFLSRREAAGKGKPHV